MHNDKFYDVLNQRAVVLRDKIMFLEKYIELIPELRIKTSIERNIERYYYKRNYTDNYKYISDKNEIHKLLVIYYAKKAVVPLKRELSHINRILAGNIDK